MQCPGEIALNATGRSDAQTATARVASGCQLSAGAASVMDPASAQNARALAEADTLKSSPNEFNLIRGYFYLSLCTSGPSSVSLIARPNFCLISSLNLSEAAKSFFWRAS